jgi:hypothetical protein
LALAEAIVRSVGFTATVKLLADFSTL